MENTVEEKLVAESVDRPVDPITKDPALLKVSSTTAPRNLSVAIITTFKKHGYAIIRCIGPKATYTACKAIALSRGHFAKADMDIVPIISLYEAIIDLNDTRPGIQFRLESDR